MNNCKENIFKKFILTLKKFWKGRVIKVKLLNIDNQKESFKKDDNLRGFYNPLNKTILIEENTFEISFEGFHNASNFLFAYAVARELGSDFASFNKFDFVSFAHIFFKPFIFWVNSNSCISKHCFRSSSCNSYKI